MTAAFQTIDAKTDLPLFIFGDHASNYIPPAYHNLGLSGDDLTRHIAWDIGTDALIRGLCRHFGCGGQVANISRLVIDFNRDPDSPGLIPAGSDGTLILENQNISDEERRARIDTFHAPYHTALKDRVEALSSHTDPLIISVHSFTPQPRQGCYRRVDIGLLVKQDELSAQAFKAYLNSAQPHLQVGINEPYSAYDLNYTVDRLLDARPLRHLAIEVKQSLLDTDEKVENITDILIPCLTSLTS